MEKKFKFGDKIRLKKGKNACEYLSTQDLCLLGYSDVAYMVVPWIKKGEYEIEFFSGNVEEKFELAPDNPNTPAHNTTSFFFYMWNCWCIEECEIVFGTTNHFWSKWVGHAQNDVFGAAEKFYKELTDHNREKLISRAIQRFSLSNQIN